MTLWLYWPTAYPKITQVFMNNPKYYGKFGLPGHEGMDIRALYGSDILACADGKVVEVGWRFQRHPYGYAVRINHERLDGRYQTVYAHGKEGSAKVKVGQLVKAGDAVMQANNTGNTQASHLHLSLIKLRLVGDEVASEPPSLENTQWFRYGKNVFINPQTWMYSFEETQKLLKEKQDATVG